MIPALTPEEWANPERFIEREGLFWSYRAPDVQGVIVGESSSEGAVIPADAFHAIAATLLEGQPFGFTHEDVEDVRHAAAEVPFVHPDLGKLLSPRLEHLAARIAALLPPETP